MMASPVSSININSQILLRQIALYVTRLIAKAKQNPVICEKTKQMIFSLLDKSKILGDMQRHVQLLDHFANDLQRSTNIGMLDQYLETALANPELSNQQQIELSDVRVLLLIRCGELEQARQVLDAAWAAADTPLLTAILHNREGVYLGVCGKYEESMKQHQYALRVAESENDLALIYSIYNNLGNLAESQKNYQEAVTYYTNGLQAAKVQADPRHCAPLEGGLAMTLDELGQYEEANRYHADARTHYSETGHLMGIVRCDLNQSKQALMRKKSAEAKEYAGRAFELAQELGDMTRMAAAWHHLGHAYLLEGKYEIAAEYMIKALQKRRELRDSSYEQSTLKRFKELIQSLEADKTMNPDQRQKILLQCYKALGDQN